DPAQVANARRRSRDPDLLAARLRLLDSPLSVRHQHLHADRGDMPAGGGEPAEQRLAPFLLVEVKSLRIVFGGEFLDRLRGEGVGANLAARAHFYILVEIHRYCSAATARLTMIGDVISHSATPAALRAVHLKVTIPVSGRLFEIRASVISTSSVRSSSGRSGASQRPSPTPGEPSEAVRPIKPSHSRRIITEQRCQPEPDRPLSIERLAASSSRCIGCGSNSPAKARISSRVTRRGPNVPKRPGLKSSNVSVVMMKNCRKEARLWPLFPAISTRPHAWLGRHA